MVSLYMASDKKVPLHIGGTVGGVPQQICSLPAYLNGGKVPNLRELRGIVEGRSIVAASKWTEVDGTAFDAIGFAVTSANCAADEGGDFLAEVNAHRENVIDTLRENDRSHLQAKALAAFDARIAELSPLYAAEGVTVERDSTAGDNGALVDVHRVLDGGAVVGHVFAGVNRGRVEFKAQSLGGALVAWNSDVIGAVRALVAAMRRDAKAANEGPKEEAYNLGSTDKMKNAQHAIDCAVEQTNGAEVGASLTLDYPGHEEGYVFIMWAEVNGKTVRNTLAAKVTDVHRLMVHWAGFVENVRELRKAASVRPVKAWYSVAVVARQKVMSYTGVKTVDYAALTINHCEEGEQAEVCREAARQAIHAWTPDSHDDTYIHDFMSLCNGLSNGAALAWEVRVTFN